MSLIPKAKACLFSDGLGSKFGKKKSLDLCVILFWLARGLRVISHVFGSRIGVTA